MSIFTSYFTKLMDYSQTIPIFWKYFLPNFEFRNIFRQLGWQDIPFFPPLDLGIKGNMHHKHDVSLKDAFYITDMAAWIFLKILHHKQRGTFCPFTLPSLFPHFSFSPASDYHLIREMVIWAWWEGKVRKMRR